MLFLLVVGVIQIGLVISILLFANRGPRHPRNLLAAHLAVFGTLILHSALIDSGRILQFPHFFRIGVPVSYLIGPTAYLYVRSVLYCENSFRLRDLWHALPAVLNLFEMLPYFLRSAAYKRDLLSQMIDQEGSILLMEQGLLPPGLHLVLRSGLVLGYAVYLIFMVRRGNRNGARNGNAAPVKSSTRRWLFWFSLLLAFFGGSIFLVSIFYSQVLAYTWSAVNIVLAGETLAILLILFFRPGILYGLDKEETTSDRDYPSSSILDADQLGAYMQTIERHMKAHNPYLREGYKLTDLARETGIPRHQLSATINEGFGVHFNDFINALRIKFVTEEMDPAKWESLSVAGISKEAGFRSRSSFTRAFKKTMGMTPSAFRQKLSQGI